MTKIPRRVFLSHTSEFEKYPEEKSFIAAAITAVNKAECVPCDMQYFTARDKQPAAYCEEKVRECDVYIGIIGLSYGSPVRDRPEVSYTELEYEAACQNPAKTRLIFFLKPSAIMPLNVFAPKKYRARQEKFRKRLSGAGHLTAEFDTADQLENLVNQALREELGADVEPGRAVRIEWPEGKSPYPGLEWFSEEYAPLYFGRDREVDELIARLSRPGGRFVLISGASGSGKSSLVGAGVWHALIDEGRIPGSRKWRWLRVRPGGGDTPFVALAWGLGQVFPQLTERPDALAMALSTDLNKLSQTVRKYVSDDQELVLFVDQLEELFTSPFDNEHIKRFLGVLVSTACDENNRVRVVTTLRSEFLGRIEESESEAILDRLNEGYHYHLGPVSPRALQDMIEKPAKATGYQFEPEDLVNDILNDASHEPGQLPLVAYALKKLFERCHPLRQLTREAYEAVGKVAGAIGIQADQIMVGLAADALTAFNRVFAELVHIERDQPAVRKRVAMSTFAADESAQALIHALAAPDCRVLITDEKGGTPTVEVAHEKLFTAWERLRKWIDQGGDALRLIEHAEEAAQRWAKQGQRSEDLWRKELVDEVKGALARFGKTADAQLTNFLNPQKVLETKLAELALSHMERALIGQKLAEFGDNRLGVGLTQEGFPDIDWIDIPGGTVKLESVKGTFEVAPFRIGRYPVTNSQFQAFVDADDGYCNPAWWEDMERSEPSDPPRLSEANYPREKVSWYEATAFCRWLTQKYLEQGMLAEGKLIHLPTEWEWQQAATGGDPDSVYPWGTEWGPARCNYVESFLNRTIAVGMYPHGCWHQGPLDMSGNVDEWCLNKYDDPKAPRAKQIDNFGEMRVLRGGSWGSNPRNVRTAARNFGRPARRLFKIGFRLAQDT